MINSNATLHVGLAPEEGTELAAAQRIVWRRQSAMWNTTLKVSARELST